MSQQTIQEKLKLYECGAFQFTDKINQENYDRHLVFDHAVRLENATQRERFEALARFCFAIF